MNYINIFAEDFDADIWEDYCKIAGVSPDSYCIKIYFEKAEGF